MNSDYLRDVACAFIYALLYTRSAYRLYVHACAEQYACVCVRHKQARLRGCVYYYVLLGNCSVCNPRCCSVNTWHFT